MRPQAPSDELKASYVEARAKPAAGVARSFSAFVAELAKTA